MMSGSARRWQKEADEMTKTTVAQMRARSTGAHTAILRNVAEGREWHGSTHSTPGQKTALRTLVRWGALEVRDSLLAITDAGRKIIEAA
jgi:hypothetical protein